MPVVYLHGVSTRTNEKTAAAIRKRDALIRVALLSDNDTENIFNPPWGDLLEPAAPPDNPIVPRLPGAIPLSAPFDGVLPLGQPGHSLADSVDEHFAMALDAAPDCGIDDVARAALQAAAQAQATPGADVRDILANQISVSQPAGGEAEGFGTSLIGHAVDRLRPALTSVAAGFLGDVFGYLANRGSASKPGPVPELIAGTLNSARTAADEGNAPLIVIGHSMGGNIAFDVLTSHASHLKIDALVTVGSQVALFKQLNLFPAVAAPRRERFERPRNIRQWINVFDPLDPLAFLCEPEFSGVLDRDYRTEAGLFSVHNSYFDRASFFERLASYIAPA